MPEPVSLAENLCLDCGLCCDGTLFERVVLSGPEEGAAAGLGEIAVGKDEKWSFPQPCPNLSGCACQAYAARPAACRGYRCRTLQALEADEIALEEGLRRVAEVRLARDRVTGAASPGDDLAAINRRWIGNIGEITADPQAARERLLVTALNLLLDRHFRNDYERLFRAMEPVSPR